MRYWAFVLMAAAVFGVAGASAARAQDRLDLELACEGKGRGMQDEQASASFNSRNDSGTASATVTKHVEYDARLRLHLTGDEGTIVLPPRMLPPLRSRRDGEGGIKLTSLTVTDRVISGQFTLNFLNKPKFTIDRATGSMELAGFGGGFSGVCQKVATEPSARKF